MPRAVRAYWLAAAVATCLLGTTLAVAPTYGYHYDVATIERVEVHEFDDAPASTARLDDVREGSVSPSVEARGASATANRSSVATNTADDFVDLASPARRTHILDGDATGGGHLWPGDPGKTPFPQGWSGDKIMHEISDIATDPAAWQNAVPQGSRTVLNGTRGGVDIRVIVDTNTGEIISGYPTNLPRRNP
jgi:hypothetical protein